MVILWFLVLLLLSFTYNVKPLAFLITSFSSMYDPLIKAGSWRTFSYSPILVDCVTCTGLRPATLSP